MCVDKKVVQELKAELTLANDVIKQLSETLKTVNSYLTNTATKVDALTSKMDRVIYPQEKPKKKEKPEVVYWWKPSYTTDPKHYIKLSKMIRDAMRV